MKENIKLGGTLLIITALAGLILAFAYDITRAPIEARAKEEKAAALKVVLDAEEFNPIDATFTDNVKDGYEALKGGKTAGYVFTVMTKGYGGDIEMLVGLNKDNTVSGIEILKHSETPGLGEKAKSDPSFAAQFKGLSTEAPLAVGSNVDAIGGATITSSAVTTGVNTSIDFYKTQVLGEAAPKDEPLDENSSKLKEILEAEKFAPTTAKTDDTVTAVFEGLNGDVNAGYVLAVSTKGYGGTIEMLVGIKADSTISGMEILKHSETPGLGSKAKDDPAFAEGFKGVSANDKIALGKDVNAITGATVTSTAVTDGVNAAIEFFNNNLKGAK